MITSEYIPPPEPTIKRLYDLQSLWGDISLSRALVYEALARSGTGGKLLDVGGGDSAPYRNILDCESYDSVNINAGLNPTWVVDIGQSYPAHSSGYDVAISLNTLEHIYEPAFVISEMLRSLKPGGVLLLAVPFMFRVHGSPEDYLRMTPRWFEVTLSQMPVSRLEVQPLIWGPFSVGAISSGLPGPVKKARFFCAKILDLFYSSFRKLPAEPTGPSASATCFWIKATKRL